MNKQQKQEQEEEEEDKEEEEESNNLILLPNLPFLIQAKIFGYVNEIGWDLVCSRFFKLASSIFTTLDYRLIKRECNVYDHLLHPYCALKKISHLVISNVDCLLLGHDKPTIELGQGDNASIYSDFIKDNDEDDDFDEDMDEEEYFKIIDAKCKSIHCHGCYASCLDMDTSQRKQRYPNLVSVYGGYCDALMDWAYLKQIIVVCPSLEIENDFNITLVLQRHLNWIQTFQVTACLQEYSEENKRSMIKDLQETINKMKSNRPTERVESFIQFFDKDEYQVHSCSNPIQPKTYYFDDDNNTLQSLLLDNDKERNVKLYVNVQ
ncbi:hypothetical protein DFA_10684 [Cavenderia fasciculata]|uniref:Uncharacterized protein n=1 Tax=Cavenderia fasciculata TaxID=261658 RepID=F4QB39_CACFS|nr:uncharacterized protein DFA_10684 [Cavenderia fasciculata]EGG14811.1 hypothetical protein DFA_10684 [Cavenderia fasciculata]|eukprot:XP_004351327.1 hypothetical protein DFA_10684 [Cavenderia fasciculata]